MCCVWRCGGGGGEVGGCQPGGTRSPAALGGRGGGEGRGGAGTSCRGQRWAGLVRPGQASAASVLPATLRSTHGEVVGARLGARRAGRDTKSYATHMTVPLLGLGSPPRPAAPCPACPAARRPQRRPPAPPLSWGSIFVVGWVKAAGGGTTVLTAHPQTSISLQTGSPTTRVRGGMGPECGEGTWQISAHISGGRSHAWLSRGGLRSARDEKSHCDDIRLVPLVICIQAALSISS